MIDVFDVLMRRWVGGWGLALSMSFYAAAQ